MYRESQMKILFSISFLLTLHERPYCKIYGDMFPKIVSINIGLIISVFLPLYMVYLLCKVNKKVNASKARTNISEYYAGSEE